MTYTINTHRKLDNGRYLLEVEDDKGTIHTFEWPATTTLSAVEYEAQQLNEAKALLESAQRKGKKLKSEGTTL